MKQLNIIKEVEKEVEAIFLHCQALKDYKKIYPYAVKSAINEFQLKEYTDSNFFPDDIDNFKIRLYSLILKSQKENAAKEELKMKEMSKKLN